MQSAQTDHWLKKTEKETTYNIHTVATDCMNTNYVLKGTLKTISVTIQILSRKSVNLSHSGPPLWHCAFVHWRLKRMSLDVNFVSVADDLSRDLWIALLRRVVHAYFDVSMRDGLDQRVDTIIVGFHALRVIFSLVNPVTKLCENSVGKRTRNCWSSRRLLTDGWQNLLDPLFGFWADLYCAVWRPA